MNAQISKEFTASEANATLRGLVKTLCNAISDFSDSEDGELVEDGQGFKRLCDSGERALICANSIPNPDAHAPELHEACTALLTFIQARCIPYADDPWGKSAVERAQAALAKALPA